MNFADDSALLLLLFDQKAEHGRALEHFVNWYKYSYFQKYCFKIKRQKGYGCEWVHETNRFVLRI